MAASYPYVSSQGALVKAFEQFRKAVPASVDAELLKKFEIAPKNESYVISTLRFIGVIDEEGKRVEAQTGFLYEGEDKFAKGLEERIREAYTQLFVEHGEDAWNEPKAVLTSWFRVTDKTSDVVGGRQAQTFLTLSAIAGHGEPAAASATRAAAAKPAKKATKVTAKASANPSTATPILSADRSDASVSAGGNLGLSVRVEVNLPASGTPDVYDSIFASIRKHLIDRD